MESKWVLLKMERQKELELKQNNKFIKILMILSLIMFFIIGRTENDKIIVPYSVIGLICCTRVFIWLFPIRKESELIKNQIQSISRFLDKNELTEMEIAEFDEAQAEFEEKKGVIFLGKGCLKLTPSFMIYSMNEKGFYNYMKVSEIQKVDIDIDYEDECIFKFNCDEDEWPMFFIIAESLSQKDDIIYRIREQYGDHVSWVKTLIS